MEEGPQEKGTVSGKRGDLDLKKENKMFKAKKGGGGAGRGG